MILMITDILIGAVLVLIIGAAVVYIIKEKKQGVKCIGCPHAGTCAYSSKKGGTCQCPTSSDNS